MRNRLLCRYYSVTCCAESEHTKS